MNKQDLKNLIKPSLILILLGLPLILNAQISDKLAVSSQYAYVGKNTISIGLEYRLNSSSKSPMNVGASTLYIFSKSSKIIPEIHFNISQKLGTFEGISLSPDFVQPQFGINIFNLLMIYTGYTFPFKQESELRGISLGLKLNLGLKQHSKFFDSFSVVR